MELNTRPVWTVWHGGTNYAHGYVADDVELWPTLEAALQEAERRKSTGHWCPSDFPFAHKEHASVLTPTVDEASYVDVYLADPAETTGPIPDARYEWSEAFEEYVAFSGDDGGPCCLGHARGSDHDPDCFVRTR